MSLSLFAHPLSSYCQKVLTALYEAGTPFTYRQLSFDDKETGAEFAQLWPIQRMPLLRDGDRSVMESSIIIEYLDRHYPGLAPMVPADPAAAQEVRFLDRVFDNYVMTPMQKIVFNAIRPAESRDPYGVDEAKVLLGRAYAWLDAHLKGRTWAAGDRFTLADCAAAPALFYADWVLPFGDGFPTLLAYRQRLLKRPSFARAVDEGRPFRHFFPLGAPDRD
ncbi:glutathione S-transferase family protein [Dongia sp.]|uniref:glutathione S-transferase family protein n=1 Tax=Dongia sp. TaxID=1977262 RepID=UPI0035B3ABF6